MHSILSQSLNTSDPKLFELIRQEGLRQEKHLELIASENYVSHAILQAQGSILTNKYAEGYPEKRYYGGCEVVDQIEQLAIERAKQLFGAAYVNVQPHSGSQANFAVYLSLLQPGDRILGMKLSCGGHLTHGASASASGQLYQVAQYGLDAAGYIDYDEVEQCAEAFKPKLIIAGFSAYSRIIDWARFRTIADRVGAYLLVDMAHVAGLVAANLYPNPLPYAHVVTTTTHKTLAGPRGGMILSAEPDPALHKRLNSGLFPSSQGGPLLHVVAAKAVALLEASQPAFRLYQEKVLENARSMASTFLERGYRVVSGGTDNHMLLLDLSTTSWSGQAAERACSAIGIIVNKNTVPGERRSPFITSGLRLGTPAVTRRGMRSPEVTQVANWIADLLDAGPDQILSNKLADQVAQLCLNYPVYNALRSLAS